MKPAPFEYFAPTEMDEVVRLLTQYGDEAKILAGGQSLMPLLNMRLARPQVIIDINRLDGLAYMTPQPDAGLAIGALTRQRALERAPLIRGQQPLLAAMIPAIGHFQIRNRGTIGGSLVHADPAAELPALSLALEAKFVLHSAAGQRLVAAEDFFLTYLTTAIEPQEILTEIRLPRWDDSTGGAFQEVCRRAGDFALVGAIACVQVTPDDVCQAARLIMFGVGGTPVRLRNAEELVSGRHLDASTLAEVSALVSECLDPEGDIHASATYRREVGGVLARRTLGEALARAKGELQS